MSDQDLKQLALDYAAGLVYTSRDVPKDLVPQVFMPWLFAGEEQTKDIVLLVGNTRTDQTAGRAINGFPIFYSCRFFKEADAKRFAEFIVEAQAARDSFLKKDIAS